MNLAVFSVPLCFNSSCFIQKVFLLSNGVIYLNTADTGKHSMDLRLYAVFSVPAVVEYIMLFLLSDGVNNLNTADTGKHRVDLWIIPCSPCPLWLNLLTPEVQIFLLFFHSEPYLCRPFTKPTGVVTCR